MDTLDTLPVFVCERFVRPRIVRALCHDRAVLVHRSGSLCEGQRNHPAQSHQGRDSADGPALPATVEVPFGTLKKRVPFKDTELREELRRRLNEAPGVDIPAAKLELYPSFDIAYLANEAVWDVVLAALEWFADQTRRSRQS